MQNKPYKKDSTKIDLVRFIKSVKKGKKKERWLFGRLTQYKKSDPEYTKNFELKYWAFTKTKGKSSHPSKHQKRSTEFNFIIKGHVKGYVGKKRVELRTGDYIVIRPGVKSNIVETVLSNTIGLTIKAPSIPGDTKKST